MAQSARAPRRGERGFKAAAEGAGGDPRVRELDEARARRREEAATPAVEPRGSRGVPTAASARQRPSSGQRRPISQRALAGAGVTVNDGASFILGLLAWVLTMQYIRGGQKQVKAWLRAKFLNQTSGGRP